MTPPLNAEAFLFVLPALRDGWGEDRITLHRPTLCREKSLPGSEAYCDFTLRRQRSCSLSRPVRRGANEWARVRAGSRFKRRIRGVPSSSANRAPSQFRNASGFQYDPVQTH